MNDPTLLTFQRCDVCGWPLDADPQNGCTKGNCSQRPLPKREVVMPPKNANVIECCDVCGRTLRNHPGSEPCRALFPVWPDESTERAMLEDARLLESEFEPTSTGADAACHIKALLCRVRELEASNADYRKVNRVFVGDWPILKADREKLKQRAADLEKENALLRQLIR